MFTVLFFCSDVSLNAAACSFTANNLIVSLKNSLPKLKFGNGAFCVTHVQDGKTLVINFYFLLVSEMDFILISFLLIKEQKERERLDWSISSGKVVLGNLDLPPCWGQLESWTKY